MIVYKNIYKHTLGLTFNETVSSLVEREVLNAMDERLKLIGEIRKRPPLWDFLTTEHMKRVGVPDMWQAVANSMGPNVTVDECKKKWKNLRDAYRAEVKRIEARIERDLRKGTYNPSKDYSSKWAYFKPMRFIKDITKPRKKKSLDNTNATTSNDGFARDHTSNDNISNDNISTGYVSNDSDFDPYAKQYIKLEPEVNMDIETYSIADDDEENEEFIEGNDEESHLYNEEQYHQPGNFPEPQVELNVQERNSPQFQNEDPDNSLLESQYSKEIHNANNSELSKFTIKFNVPEPHNPIKQNEINNETSSCSNCKCKNSVNPEDHNSNQASSSNSKGPRDLSHVSEADYNFLISFVPQMKKMSEMQNLQFRAKMTDLVLKTMSQTFSSSSGVSSSQNI